MKKKIIACLLIIILLGFSSYVSAQNNIQKETIKPEQENNDIDHFSWCVIRGTYEIKKYNEYGSLVLKNEHKNNKTLRITGIGWTYEYGELYSPTFGSVKTHKVKAPGFIGYCFNGRVFGLGHGFVDFE